MAELVWSDNNPPAVSAANLNTFEDRLAVSPREYGAVGDGVVDDTAAMTSMLSAIGPLTAGIAPVVVDLGEYTYRITSTITVTRMAIAWKGRGVGNPKNYAYPGRGSALRWDGAAGSAMFSLVDCWHQLFEGIFFQGNVTNKPSAFIYSAGGGPNGTNMHHTYRKCRFGSGPWTSPSTSTGAKTADAGIQYGGTNANNDRMYLEDCAFDDITTGLSLPNTQSVWGSTMNTAFTNCTTGIDTYADHTLVNCNFQTCGTDLAMHSTARVRALSWGSEHSSQIANVADPGGSLTVTGGRWLIQNAMTNTRLIDYQNLGDATSLTLTGVSVENIGGISPKPKVYGRRSSAGGSGHLSVIGCPGLTASSDFDIAGASGGIYLFIKSHGLSSDTTLGAGQTFP